MSFFYTKSYTHIPTESTDKAVLMLHGFNSSKEEVKDYFKTLGSELAAMGVSSFAPDLFQEKGKLLPLRLQYEIVKESIQYLLDSGYKDVYVCGFSLGAYLSMKAAAEFKLKKVFLLSPVFSIYDDLTDFLGFTVPEWLASGQDHILYDQPFVGVVSMPREFLVEIQTAKTDFDLAGGELTVIAGSEDFSAPNSERIKACQSAAVLFSSHIFPGADHIFNAFDSEKQRLSDVSALVLERI